MHAWYSKSAHKFFMNPQPVLNDGPGGLRFVTYEPGVVMIVKINGEDVVATEISRTADHRRAFTDSIYLGEFCDGTEKSVTAESVEIHDVSKIRKGWK